MTIKNTTTLKKEHVKGMMMASQFTNSKYKKFKLIYNGFGLLAGMMFIRYFIFQMLGNGQYDKIIMYAFGAAAFASLYAGMYGMDRSNLKKFNEVYKDAVGKSYTYEIDSENICVVEQKKTSGAKGSGGDTDAQESASEYEIPWSEIIKVEQDIDNFYAFTDETHAFVLSKKGFTQCESKDFAVLVKALMGSDPINKV